MKKILYAVTKSNFGGAQRYVLELAIEAKNKGFETIVACGGNGLLVQKLQAELITVHSINSSNRNINFLKEIQTLFNLYLLVKKEKPDIVHLNSPKLGGIGSFVIRLARLTQKSDEKVKHIVYTNHGWPFMEDRPFWQNTLIRFFSWLTIIFCESIIVLSEREEKMVSHWIGAKIRKSDKSYSSKIHMIRNGIKPFATFEKEQALIALLGEEPALKLIKKNKRIIGNISELHKNKGYTYALQGLRQYKEAAGVNFNSHYIVVSEGEEFASITHQIQNLGLEEDVTLTGYIRDAREYIKAFDLFLLSSIKEGLPYSILEAGYAEVPVISTNVGGISEIIQNNYTGFLIHPSRPQEIKHVLTYIDEHSGEARIYSKNLKELLMKELSFESFVEKTFNLYQN